MPDITMCSGKLCRLKNTCYRYLAEPDKYHQSYYLKPPKTAGGKCVEYWKYKEKVKCAKK